MKIPKGDLDYLGIGEILVDFISTEETDNLVNAFTFRKYQGGSPANIAVNIAKLGGQSALIAKTGIGSAGKYLKSELLRAGVSTEYLVMDHKVNTTVVFISRSLKTADSQAFRSADFNLAPHEVLEAAISRAKVVHASAWALSLEPCRSAVFKAFELASSQKKIVSLDPNYNPSIWPDFRDAIAVIQRAMGYATIVKSSLDDATRIFGRDKTPEKYIEKIHSLGPRRVIFTMGSAGIMLSHAGKISHIPARKIEAVDATGAGDAFWAGFIVAFLDGNTLRQSILFAREVVERKLTMVGPLPDHLDRNEFYEKIKERPTPPRPPRVKKQVNKDQSKAPQVKAEP